MTDITIENAPDTFSSNAKYSIDGKILNFVFYQHQIHYVTRAGECYHCFVYRKQYFEVKILLSSYFLDSKNAIESLIKTYMIAVYEAMAKGINKGLPLRRKYLSSGNYKTTEEITSYTSDWRKLALTIKERYPDVKKAHTHNCIFRNNELIGI